MSKSQKTLAKLLPNAHAPFDVLQDMEAFRSGQKPEEGVVEPAESNHQQRNLAYLLAFLAVIGLSWSVLKDKPNEYVQRLRQIRQEEDPANQLQRDTQFACLGGEYSELRSMA